MKYIYIVLLASTIVSCSKEMDVKAPDFDVQVEKTTYKVGDTVRFSFSGKAENITFYSGMSGANYEYRDRIKVEGAIPRLSFRSVYGSGLQFDNLRLMATTHISSLTKEGILGAQWTDITNRAILQRSGFPVPANAPLLSGDIDLSDLVEDGEPLYLAFKHVGYNSPTIPVGTRLITGFWATALLPDGTQSVVADLLSANWTFYDIKNPAVNWVGPNPNVAAPDLRLLGGAQNVPDIEDWAVTKALYFDKTIPDVGLPIQYIAGNSLSRYDFAGYTRPGTYKVTFVGTNVNVDAQKSVVRQLEITITP